jgi:hypothetical protein
MLPSGQLQNQNLFQITIRNAALSRGPRSVPTELGRKSAKPRKDKHNRGRDPVLVASQRIEAGQTFKQLDRSVATKIDISVSLPRLALPEGLQKRKVDGHHATGFGRGRDE